MIRQVQGQARNSACRSGLGCGAVTAVQVHRDEAGPRPSWEAILRLGPAPGLAELESIACLARLRQVLGANMAAGREAEGAGSAQVGESWLLRPSGARRALRCAS